MISDKRIKVVCGLIQNQQKQFLLVQRSAEMKHPLTWEFPGGKVQENESSEMALHRELGEELEVSVAISRQGKNIVHAYGNKQIELVPFYCTLQSETIKLNEHKDLCWLPWDELPVHEGLLEADVKLLAANA